MSDNDIDTIIQTLQSQKNQIKLEKAIICELHKLTNGPNKKHLYLIADNTLKTKNRVFKNLVTMEINGLLEGTIAHIPIENETIELIEKLYKNQNFISKLENQIKIKLQQSDIQFNFVNERTHIGHVGGATTKVGNELIKKLNDLVTAQIDSTNIVSQSKKKQIFKFITAMTSNNSEYVKNLNNIELSPFDNAQIHDTSYITTYIQNVCEQIFSNLSVKRYPNHTPPSVPRPNHGGLNHLRSIKYSVFIMTVIMKKLNPKQKIDIFKDRQFLIMLIIAPMFVSISRINEKSSTGNQWPSPLFKYLYPKLGVDKESWLTTYSTLGLISGIFYMIIMKKCFPTREQDIELLGFAVSYYWRNSTKSLGNSLKIKNISITPLKEMDFNKENLKFFIYNVLILTGHYLDHCRLGTSFQQIDTPFIKELLKIFKIDSTVRSQIIKLVIKTFLDTEFNSLKSSIPVGNIPFDTPMKSICSNLGGRYQNVNWKTLSLGTNFKLTNQNKNAWLFLDLSANIKTLITYLPTVPPAQTAAKPLSAPPIATPTPTPTETSTSTTATPPAPTAVPPQAVTAAALPPPPPPPPAALPPPPAAAAAVPPVTEITINLQQITVLQQNKTITPAIIKNKKQYNDQYGLCGLHAIKNIYVASLDDPSNYFTDPTYFNKFIKFFTKAQVDKIIGDVDSIPIIIRTIIASNSNFKSKYPNIENVLDTLITRAYPYNPQEVCILTLEEQNKLNTFRSGKTEKLYIIAGACNGHYIAYMATKKDESITLNIYNPDGELGQNQCNPVWEKLLKNGCINIAAPPVANPPSLLVTVKPYGVLGKGINYAFQTDNHTTLNPTLNTCIVDPAGLNYMQFGNISGAGGASKSIYKFISLTDDDEFKKSDVHKYFKDTCKTATCAIGHSYLNTNVIHVVGPNYNTTAGTDINPKTSTITDNKSSLQATYENIFTAFNDLYKLNTEINELRLLPVSSNIFAKKNTDGKNIFPLIVHTAKAVKSALIKVPIDPSVQIKMCIYDNKNGAFDAAKKAFPDPAATESTASPSGSSNIFLKFYGIPDTTTGFESKLRHQQKQNFKINNNHTISETINAIRNKFTIPNNFNIRLILLGEIISETDQLSNRISKYNLHSVNHLDVVLIQNKNGPPPVIIPLTTFNDSIFQKNLVDRIVKGLDRKPIKIELNVDGMDCQNDGDNDDGGNMQKIKFVVGSKDRTINVDLNKSISDQSSIIIKEIDINNTTANISDDDIIGTKEGDLNETPINIGKPLKNQGITGPGWTIDLQIMEDLDNDNNQNDNDDNDDNHNEIDGPIPPPPPAAPIMIRFEYAPLTQIDVTFKNAKNIPIILNQTIGSQLDTIKKALAIPSDIPSKLLTLNAIKHYITYNNPSNQVDDIDTNKTFANYNITTDWIITVVVDDIHNKNINNMRHIRFEYGELTKTLRINEDMPINDQLGSIKEEFGIKYDNKYIKLEAVETHHKTNSSWTSVRKLGWGLDKKNVIKTKTLKALDIDKTWKIIITINTAQQNTNATAATIIQKVLRGQKNRKKVAAAQAAPVKAKAAQAVAQAKAAQAVAQAKAAQEEVAAQAKAAQEEAAAQAKAETEKIKLVIGFANQIFNHKTNSETNSETNSVTKSKNGEYISNRNKYHEMEHIITSNSKLNQYITKEWCKSEDDLIWDNIITYVNSDTYTDTDNFFENLSKKFIKPMKRIDKKKKA